MRTSSSSCCSLRISEKSDEFSKLYLRRPGRHTKVSLDKVCGDVQSSGIVTRRMADLTTPYWLLSTLAVGLEAGAYLNQAYSLREVSELPP